MTTKRGRPPGTKPEQLRRDAIMCALVSAAPDLKLLACAKRAYALSEVREDWEVFGEGRALHVNPYSTLPDNADKPFRDRANEKAKVTLRRYTKGQQYKLLSIGAEERRWLLDDAGHIIIILRTEYVQVAEHYGNVLEIRGWPPHIVANLVGYSSWCHGGHRIAPDDWTLQVDRIQRLAEVREALGSGRQEFPSSPG